MSIFILIYSAGVLFEGAFSLWVSEKLILLLQLETISIRMWHVLCEQFSCSCMYTNTVRNRLQLFKESTWVVKLLPCWSSCNCNDMQTYLLKIYILLLVHFLGNFLPVKPVDQRRRQMEKTFYSVCCIMGLRAGILARKISLAMTVMMESWITHYSLYPVVLTK